ncbi:MAG: NAD-dependent DNA ligase LigA [Patescibacteria group bacterium]
MTKPEAQKRVEKLREVINHHRYQYHVLDVSEIPDSAFDVLKNELEELEFQFPDLVTPDSPTQRVGGEPLDKFKKVVHSEPMLSINDAFGEQEIRDWQKRIQKLVPDEKLDYYCEMKLDGLAIALIYRAGVLFQAATRGDGKIGEDVTQNIKTIQSIPLRLRIPSQRELVGIGLNTKQIEKVLSLAEKGEMEFRGEALMLKKTLAKLNQKLAKNGDQLLANPRNAAAGSIRQLDPKIAASRELDFYVYKIVSDFGQIRHEQEHQLARLLGFKIVPENRFCKDLEAVIKFHHEREKARDKMPYECDGVVVAVDRVDLQNELGAVGKSPRWMQAYKFAPPEATTVVENIKVQIGRTGKLTPVAVLRPVELAGVTVSHATLHNQDEIDRLDIRIGDTVIVGRAGDVIPDVKKVITEMRTGNEKKFRIPTKCPMCEGEIIKKEGEVDYYCANKKCFAIRRCELYHFVSKKAFNIEGLGPKIIDQLMDEGLIRDSADIFELKIGDVIGLDRFAQKSAQNLIESIKSKKEVDLARFVYALGIRHVGEENAILLAQNFGSLEKIAETDFETLEKIGDIGGVIAQSVVDWFKDKKNLDLIERMRKNGVKIKNFKTKDKASQKLLGQSFVLTGTLESLTRDEAQAKIRALGGDVVSAVSSKTSYVVVGENPGSKYDKAQELNIKILNEAEFKKIIS